MYGNSGFGKFNKKGNGFTLVELIVVLVIIAVLAALAVPTFLFFMDKGRENGYKANASKSLSATQGALSALFSDSSARLSPSKRQEVKKTAAVGDSYFVVWTKDKLVDRQTKALPENIGSFTVDKALYGEAGCFFSYVNGNWEKLEATEYENAITEMAADNTKAIYMWPYKWDSAYLDTDPEDPNPDSDEDDAIKVVLLKLDPDYLRYVYFTREDRNVNSGLDSIRLLFWKEGNDVKSTWNIKGGRDIFEGEDGYTYELHLERYTYLGWLLDSSNVPAMSVSSISDYIFNDASKKNYYEFTIGLEGIDPNATVEYIQISRNRFSSFISSSAMDIKNVEKISTSTYQNKDALPSQAVRIDDESVPDGYAYAWRDGNKVLWWSNAAKNYMPEDCSGLFANNTHLVYFDFSGMDFSHTSTMNSMFAGCTKLESLSGLGNETENSLTDVSSMFSGCSALTDPGTDTLSTGALTGAKEMFANCTSILTIEFSDYFDTANVTDFSNMFAGCTNVSVIETEKLDTASAETLSGMFENCTNLSTPDVTSWDTANCTNFENTFKGCESMAASLDLSNWNLQKAKTLASAFEGCKNVPEIKVGVTGWNLVNCEDLSKTFKGCSSLTALNSQLIGSSRSLKNVSEMFAGCYSLENINLSRMSFSGVVDMSKMFSMEEFKSDSGFASACALKTVKFSTGIDTANVTDMNSMFRDCVSLTGVDGIASFRTEKVSDMSYMFAYTNSLAEIDLSSFNTRNLSNYEGMFFYEEGKSRLATVYASPRFDIGNRGAYKMFKNNILVGSRNTEYVQKSTDQEEGFDTAEFAKADGWQGEEGYFKAKYREVYVSRSGLSDMFSEHTEKIVKVNTDDYTVSTIQYVDGLVNIENKDASKQTEYYLFAWREGDTIKWWTDADVAILDADLKNMFNNNYKNNIVSFDFSGFDVRDVTGLNETFYNCKNLESVTFGNMFYADKLQNTYRMFGSCEKLKSVDMTDLHAGSGSLTNVKNMFENCYSLEDLTFASDFDTSNVTSTNSMFFNCRALKSIDVSSFDFEKVTDAYRTFSGLNEVTSITLPQVCDLQNCTTMGAMFEKCYKLETLDLSCIKTSNKLTNLSYTFNESKALKNIDLSGWNISAVTNYKCTFRNCENLQSIVMKGGKSQGTERGDMFSGCKGGEAGVISVRLADWNFNTAAAVGEFISTCNSAVLDYDISGANMNNVTSFANFVKNRTNVKMRSINLSDLKNVGNVTSLESAFSKCNYLTDIEFGDFDFSKVTSFKEMFNGCSAIESVDFSGVTNNRVDTVYWMFINCSKLKTVDFGDISFENLNTATNAFSGCGELTTVYVSDSYKLKSGVNNQDMFANNNKLKGSAGTEYSNSKKKAIYAWPDGKDGREGYFTIR